MKESENEMKTMKMCMKLCRMYMNILYNVRQYLLSVNCEKKKKNTQYIQNQCATLSRNASLAHGFTNAIGTNGTNVTNIRQQMVQTEYSVGNYTNEGKVT